jgi:hypothetical protein
MPVQGYSVNIPTNLTSAARTTDGNSNWYDVSEFGRVTLYLDITAIAGTGTTLTANLQESPDQSVIRTVDSVGITAAGDYHVTTDEHIKYVRANYTITGGASKSVTFSAVLGART